jgi:hypothetical protein
MKAYITHDGIPVEFSTGVTLISHSVIITDSFTATWYLGSLEHWDRVFKFHSRHGFLFTFILFVLGSGLAAGWSPVQGVLLIVSDQETEVKRAFRGCPVLQMGATEEGEEEDKIFTWRLRGWMPNELILNLLLCARTRLWMPTYFSPFLTTSSSSSSSSPSLSS